MSPSILKKYAVLIFVCVSSSLFFLGLYRFNNKYSQKTIQAANGILALSEKDLQEAPLRFLVSGWAFYPGVLLTPEELQDSVHYMRYISIGEQTGFSSPDSASPYGCGTYQMTFFLPERKGGYALELPEVFSSCLLYLDDDLILQMGDPAAGTPVIQHRLITFYGGKPVTLTAAVSNYDHFYGGIVYPPAFGTPLAVNTARGVRFAVCLFFCTITLICALLSFYFGLRMKQKNAQLFGMICLSLCGLSSYPVLHMLAAVPVFPWYMLELACNYLVIWLVILLQNRICSPGLVPAAVSNTAGGVLFLAALGYGAMASRLSPAAVRLFSASVSFCKVAFSLYLLLTAMAALRRDLKLHRLFFTPLLQLPALRPGIGSFPPMSPSSAAGSWNGGSFLSRPPSAAPCGTIWWRGTGTVSSSRKNADRCSASSPCRKNTTGRFLRRCQKTAGCSTISGTAFAPWIRWRANTVRPISAPFFPRWRTRWRPLPAIPSQPSVKIPRSTP